MKHLLLITLFLIACLSYSVLAQPGPGNRPGPGQEPGFNPGMGPMQGPNPGFDDRGSGPFQGQPPQHRPAMECTSNGVFILQGGTLVKLDPKTLDKKGEIELFQKQGGMGDNRDFSPEIMPMRQQGPAEMLLSGSNLLLVTGEKFIKIETASFKIKIETNLPPMFRPDMGKGRMDGQEPMRDDQMGMMQPEPMPMMSPMPELKILGGILYILRGEQVIAVNIDTGKVMADNNLRPQRPMMNPRPKEK